ncbi:MAG: c-type cytochrome domain-containing protein, partial [Planctomycetaceae bacterium]
MMITTQQTRRLCLGALVLSALVAPAALPAQDGDAARKELINSAYAILKQNCYDCHGAQSNGSLTNVLDRGVLVPEDKPSADRPEDAAAVRGFIVPGSPEKSLLFSRITLEDENLRMPPAYEGKEALTPAEIEILRRWIAEANAEFPRAERT